MIIKNPPPPFGYSQYSHLITFPPFLNLATNHPHSYQSGKIQKSKNIHTKAKCCSQMCFVCLAKYCSKFLDGWMLSSFHSCHNFLLYNQPTYNIILSISSLSILFYQDIKLAILFLVYSDYRVCSSLNLSVDFRAISEPSN